jgi:AraC-like DNA-binding protein
VDCFRRITPGTERWTAHSEIPRHRHDQPYAALTLSGGYQESGTPGCYRARAGLVLLHRSFDAHLDRFGQGGARILNLPLGTEPRFGLGSVTDPDGIARLAQKDLTAAGEALREQLQPHSLPVADWPELLARDLSHAAPVCLSDWADRHGLAPETVSRGFRKVFGVAPARFGLEARTQQALGLIADGLAPLAAVAAAAGFADQAHMTRAVTALTGRPPGHWARLRRQRSHAGAGPADTGGEQPGRVGSSGTDRGWRGARRLSG